MNPVWLATVFGTISNATRKCPHCGKKAAYPQKKSGQFHTCKRCKRRFQEKTKQ